MLLDHVFWDRKGRLLCHEVVGLGGVRLTSDANPACVLLALNSHISLIRINSYAGLSLVVAAHSRAFLVAGVTPTLRLLLIDGCILDRVKGGSLVCHVC